MVFLAPIWLRGGWTNFVLGQITREHEDSDFFAWARDADRMSEAFEEAGFCPQEGPPPTAQRDFFKNEESI